MQAQGGAGPLRGIVCEQKQSIDHIDDPKPLECPVCLDEDVPESNWVPFLCGHGTCRCCHSKLKRMPTLMSVCPICRHPLDDISSGAAITLLPCAVLRQPTLVRNAALRTRSPGIWVAMADGPPFSLSWSPENQTCHLSGFFIKAHPGPKERRDSWL